MNKKYLNFYKEVYWAESDIDSTGVAKSAFRRELSEFISTHGLSNKKILEIGSGAGEFQDVVKDYTGIDVVADLGKFYHKKFCVINADEQTYPFDSESFDSIFTYAVFEHIPNINKALTEMLRVLRPGGTILFSPAWQVRPWVAEGYSVRPYKDLTATGKLIKATIPLRNNIIFRLMHVIPKRIVRTIRYLMDKNFSDKLDYSYLKPNYDFFWTSDSDACNHIDPHAAILWFIGNGCSVAGYKNIFSALLVRTGSLVVVKQGDRQS